jgi:hypothetical protein
MNAPSITIEALAKLFRLNVGELEQLHEWVNRYSDLIEESPGVLNLGQAFRTVEHIRAGYNPNLRIPKSSVQLPPGCR